MGPLQHGAGTRGVVPIVHKSMTLSTPLGRITRESIGLGDIVTFARYTVYGVDTEESTFRIAPFGGFKMPTGASDESDALGVLPRPLQPGSGSWDGLGGLAVTYQTKQWELDADAGFKRNTETDAFRFGDEFFADLSFQYRVRRPLRRLLAGAVIATALGPTAATLSATEQAPAQAPAEDQKQAVVTVRGMQCPFCAYGIKKHLAKLPGATRVDVELARNQAIVTFALDANVTDAQIRQAIRKAGFTAGAIEWHAGTPEDAR